jgi:hypothetical protein
MSIDPEEWLAVEKSMEQINHIIMQEDTTETPTEQQPHLLMISSHATKGTTSAATFSLLVHIGGRKAVALVDSGSTNSFIDYTFVSKTNCNIISTSNLSVKVVVGGTLDTCVVTEPTQYCI